MKKIKRYSALLTMTLVVFLAGCTTTQIAIEPFDKTVTVERDFDDVWTTLVRFMSTNDISISTIEKESGLISLRGENLTKDLIAKLCDGQAAFLWTIIGGGASGSIVVMDDDGFVTVNVNARFTTTSTYNGPTVTNGCNSTGYFEKSVLASISG